MPFIIRKESYVAGKLPLKLALLPSPGKLTYYFLRAYLIKLGERWWGLCDQKPRYHLSLCVWFVVRAWPTQRCFTFFFLEFFFSLQTRASWKKKCKERKSRDLVVYYVLHIERGDINFLFSINIHSFTGFLDPPDKWIRPRLYSSFLFFADSTLEDILCNASV